MTSRYSIILSFILATLLVTGTVELFYSSFNKVIRSNDKAINKDTKRTAFSQPQEKLQQRSDSARAVNNNNYNIIVQRNLFGNSSNTTDTTPHSIEPVLETTSLDLVLLGTIKGSADSQRAIIRNTTSGKQDIYSKGETVEHALIKEIMRGKIILTVNGQDEVLLMGEIKSPPLTTRKAPAVPKNSNTPPEVYTEDNNTENKGTIEQPPPAAAVIKRRLTLQSKKQPVEE